MSLYVLETDLRGLYKAYIKENKVNDPIRADKLKSIKQLIIIYKYYYMC